MAGWVNTEHAFELVHPEGGLSATRSILNRAEPVMENDRTVFFMQVDPDNAEHRRTAGVDWDTYVDLGRPEIITITIEPGDTLNP